MARSRRTRRYYRKKGRWSSNIQEVSQQITPAQSGEFSASETIMQNPSQTNSFVSQKYTVKNIECNFVMEYEGTQAQGRFIENLNIYIMYVPQGMNVTNDYNLQHPEYIMAHKFIGSPSNESERATEGTSYDVYVGQQYQPTRIRTRLARKLDTGDGIILFVKGINQASTGINPNIRINGVIRWWTKAN